MFNINLREACTEVCIPFSCLTLAVLTVMSLLPYATLWTLAHLATRNTQTLERTRTYVAVIEKHRSTLNGANAITLMKHKYRYVALGQNTRMGGDTTVAIMFSTVLYCCDEFQADRFVKCIHFLDISCLCSSSTYNRDEYENGALLALHALPLKTLVPFAKLRNLRFKR